MERGDWQTPPALADAMVSLVSAELPGKPATVVEPTCGSGALLRAAARAFPSALIWGYDIDPVRVAQASGGSSGARVLVADAFHIDWARELRDAPEPVLLLGNPPWVTSAALGRLGSSNRPERSNEVERLSGLDARTGRSNFDVSEWLILRLLEALRGRVASVAMLCKSSVARRVIERSEERDLAFAPGGLWRVPARRVFGTAVDAVLFIAHGPARDLGESSREDWREFSNLEAGEPSCLLSLRGGRLSADGARFEQTRGLSGSSQPEWRSGIKHDCARVMELAAGGEGWTNQMGEIVDLEDDVVFPLLKSSDVANGRVVPVRAVVVPQRHLTEDTRRLRDVAPRAWAYLSRHGDLLASRRSRIYEGRAPYAIFGVGPYSFAPWKVAISGLYKRVSFALVGPVAGRPVLLDDTCYFLPFESEPLARKAWLALRSPRALDYLESRIFWDCKRPIQKGVLQSLDLELLQRELGV